MNNYEELIKLEIEELELEQEVLEKDILRLRKQVADTEDVINIRYKQLKLLHKKTAVKNKMISKPTF